MYVPVDSAVRIAPHSRNTQTAWLTADDVFSRGALLSADSVESEFRSVANMPLDKEVLKAAKNKAREALCQDSSYGRWNDVDSRNVYIFDLALRREQARHRGGSRSVNVPINRDRVQRWAAAMGQVDGGGQVAWEIATRNLQSTETALSETVLRWVPFTWCVRGVGPTPRLAATPNLALAMLPRVATWRGGKPSPLL
eukprot:GHVU01043705.1.p1 GENE.GHVU01043705.1~~GHVU01043705.1.p1  ORF type:complete len:197 (+),score=8.74 GHVU01043705.1:1017-1607(+)